VKNVAGEISSTVITNEAIRNRSDMIATIKAPRPKWVFRDWDIVSL
jgi:hypothetical protein